MRSSRPVHALHLERISSDCPVRYIQILRGTTSWKRRYPAPLQCVDCRLCAVTHVQLFQDRRHVVLDRLQTYSQFGADLFVAQPTNDISQNDHLSSAQASSCIYRVIEPSLDTCLVECLSPYDVATLIYLADGVNQETRLHIF